MPDHSRYGLCHFLPGSPTSGFSRRDDSMDCIQLGIEVLAEVFGEEA
jgi:hypothetical protein